MRNNFLAKYIVLLLAAVAFVPSVYAQTKQAITHEAMWTMKRVGGGVPSPNGKWVVFSLTEPAYDEKDQVSDLWITAADGSSKPRRLTSSKPGESGAAWSPDSTRIAFAAKREGDDASQIYIIDVENGGEAQRLTNISTGARSPRWSPDGKAILFVSSVYPGAKDDEDNKRIAKERKDRKYKARVYESFPVRNWDRWLDDMQTHVMVQSLDDGAKPRDLLAGSRLVAEKGFGGRIGDGNDNIDAVWAPDGASVIFVASTDRNTGAFAETTMQVYQAAVSGGEPRQITKDRGSYGNPTFSPDGKALYAQFTPITDKVYNLARLVSIDLQNSGAARVLTTGFDRSAGSYALSPDSKTVYFTAEDAGLEKLYSVPSSGGAVSTVIDLSRGCITGITIPSGAAKTSIYGSWDSAINPPELFVFDPAAKTQRALTDFNKDALAKLDTQPVQHFWFTSNGGRRIHNLYVTPPNFDPAKKYPLLVLMHGGPYGQWRDNWGLRWNYHLLASPGYVVLLTNYTGSTGFGEKFSQNIQGDPLKTPGDEINEAVVEAGKQFAFVDTSRACAAGASYGGHLANWLLATTTNYKCLISHAGLVNLESQWGTSDSIYGREVTMGGPPWERGKLWSDQNPIRYARNFKTPILVTIGENDFRVPLNNSLENWAVLQRMRVPSRLIVFPEENHWILKPEDSRYFYGEVHKWLKQWLSP